MCCKGFQMEYFQESLFCTGLVSQKLQSKLQKSGLMITTK